MWMKRASSKFTATSGTHQTHPASYKAITPTQEEIETAFCAAFKSRLQLPPKQTEQTLPWTTT